MAKAYDIKRRRIQEGTVCEGDSVLCIVTPPQKWAYAIVFPVWRASVPPDGSRVRLKVRVHEGAVGVGVLTRSQDEFYDDVDIDEAGEETELELLVPPRDDAGPLVIRNISPDGASRLECSLMAADAEAP